MIRKFRTVCPVTALSAGSFKGGPILFSAAGGSISLFREDDHIEFDVFDSHSIHGLKFYHDFGGCLLVYGDKSLKILTLQDDRGLTSSKSLPILFQIVLELDHLDDLVLDASITQGSVTRLQIGFAHNFVEFFSLEVKSSSQGEFWHLKASQTKEREFCPTNCVLFSMSFAPNLALPKTLCHMATVASGTAFGEIVIWETSLSSSSIPLIKHVLKGHEGIVFRIIWSQKQDLILSVSDDRTVRLWDPELGISLFVGWGHTARVWDATFLGQTESRNKTDAIRFASASEDCTIRIWECRYEGDSKWKGESIATCRGHKGRGCWRILALQNFACDSSGCSQGSLISCGNDAQNGLFIVEAPSS